jgi:hypothetical protein
MLDSIVRALTPALESPFHTHGQGRLRFWLIGAATLVVESTLDAFDLARLGTSWLAQAMPRVPVPAILLTAMLACAAWHLRSAGSRRQLGMLLMVVGAALAQPKAQDPVAPALRPSPSATLVNASAVRSREAPN